MEKIYIALVDTPGFFADIIRKVTKITYCHVALSFDAQLREVYSVGRRKPSVPFFAGVIRENTEEILHVFPDAKYRITRLDCTKEQKELLRKKMEECYAHRFQYHYCVIGLPFILLHKPFYQKNYYTCSSFLARMLMEQRILMFAKHFSLVTPRDFLELEQTELMFEGKLVDFLRCRKDDTVKGEAYGT